MPSAIQHIKQRYPLARPFVTFAVCGLVYYIVLTVFLNIPVFNGETQLRPASGVGPVLGLFFGWPGILGWRREILSLTWGANRTRSCLPCTLRFRLSTTPSRM